MARFVMSNRRAGKFGRTDKTASRNAAQRAFDTLISPNSDIIGETRPESQIAREVVIFEADPQEVAAKTTSVGPDVILEPEVLHYPAIALPLDLAGYKSQRNSAVLIGAGRNLRVTLCSPEGRIANAKAILIFRGPGRLTTQLERLTDTAGVVDFQFNPLWFPSALVLIPRSDYWAMLVRGPRDGQVVECPPLPVVDSGAWWRTVVQAPSSGGAGIQVGVIDTGVGPHPDLSDVHLAGSFLQSLHNPSPEACNDVNSHGTHVAGIIGARPKGNGPPGIATECTLSAARVFASEGQGANQGDIALALDHLSAVVGADLINLSLGATQPSDIVRDAILDALERGTLCICAAANSGGPVEYPAAFPETIAVSAVGLEGWAPPGTLAAARYPAAPDRYSAFGYFLADFSCFGEQIACAAPGVGIISAVPGIEGRAPTAAMDGTSMASPITCGVLAALLSSEPEYLSLPRNLLRAEKARALLQQHCRDIGLASVYQGRGVPHAR